MSQIELFLLLLVASAVVAAVAHWVRMSYTLALLLLGLALGGLDLVRPVSLSSDLILLLFLPPLLFEAAFVIDLGILRTSWRGVAMLALPGVLLAMAVGGALVHWTTPLPWTVALLFGAIVAATDPVAVLATFRQLRTDPRLAVLMEGESLFNDAIALVLFAALVEAVDDGFRLGSAVGSFVLAVLGGAAIGVVLGWVGHVLIAFIDDHLTEMTVSVALAYGAFLGAEHLHVSGVLATLTAAMTLGALGRARGWVYSDGSERLLTDLWAFLAFVANAALFLLMGLGAPSFMGHPEYVVWGVAAALIGRAAVAYGVGALLPHLGFPLSMAYRHVLFWGGLRGAVALAAVLSLPAGFPYRPELRSMVYGVVLFTLLTQGLTIASLVRALGLQSDDPPADARPAARQRIAGLTTRGGRT